MNYLQNNFKAYKLLFTFENNLRRFIKNELEKYFGSDWLDHIQPFIKKEINEQKIKSIKYLTPELLDNNDLNYSLFSHLRQLIDKNWENIFYNFFENIPRNQEEAKKKVMDKFFENEVLRNCLMHCNLVDEKFIIQLEANINVFIAYIPNYDENIYYKLQKVDTGGIELIKDELLGLIKRKENIPKKLLDKIERDSELYINLKEYCGIPKTRSKFSLVDSFIKDKELNAKITNL